jgi:hypothetical protein
MQLNDWQRAVARNCGDGDYVQFAVDGEISDVDLDSVATHRSFF